MEEMPLPAEQGGQVLREQDLSTSSIAGDSKLGLG